MANVTLNIVSKFTDSGVKAAHGALGGLKNFAAGPVGAALAGVGAGIAAGLGTATVAAINFADQANTGMADFAAKTGIATEDLGQYKEVALSIFAGSPPLGESIGDVAKAMGQVETVTGLAGVALQNATQDALILAERFDVDINESLATASSLVKNGVAKNFDEAFDIIATGMQEGVNRTGDLNDTLNEYAQDFGALGFDGAQTLSILNAGLEAGIFNTDKIGDSINEAFINLQDPKVLEDLGKIDQGFMDIATRLNSGEISGAQAFDEIIQGLESIEDPLQQQQAGVLLFRSMWEDLGGAAIMALNDTGSEIESVTGAVEEAGAAGQNLSSMWEEAMRAFQVAVEPIGQEILPILGEGIKGVSDFLKDAQPAFTDFANTLGDKIGPWSERLGGALIQIGEAFGIIPEDIAGTDEAMAGLAGTLDLVVSGLEGVVSFIEQIAALVEMLSDAAAAAQNFASSLEDISGASILPEMGDITGNPFELTGGGLAGALGFATGGSFTVGGSGGTDSELVAFRATPGERVTVETPGQQALGNLGAVGVNGLDPNRIAEVIRQTTQQSAQAALDLFQDQLADALTAS